MKIEPPEKLFCMKKNILLLLIVLIAVVPVISQSLGGFTDDETTLYAMNKQVGQFVKRFNMDEDEFGKMLSKSDKRYRNGEMRKKLLPGMFDNYNPRTSGTLKEYFISDVTNIDQPVFLNFLDTDWYAEVSATFKVNGKDESLILFLTLEEENLGSKWIISNVYFKDFSRMFPEPDSIEQISHFLHPQSHELDFMNLKKALKDHEYVELYASTNYQPDFLTLFFYMMKMNQIKFVKIDNVKFHFFQIYNWYFELSFFNRNDMNSGWLISNLMYIKEEDKLDLIRTYRLCAN